MIAGIRNYKSIIKKKTKKHDKILLFGALISKVLIDSDNSHDELVSVNNVLREYNEMKNEKKNPEFSVEYII